MDRFSEKELERVARLSGLSLEGEEKDLLLQDMARITAYMERISRLDTSEVETRPSEETGSLREDEASDSGLSEAILMGAPRSDNGMFSVPKAVE